MTPLRLTAPVPADAYAEIRERAIFEYLKLDQQVGDVPTFFPRALVVGRAAWDEAAALAQRLAAEALELERALLARPELHRALGLPAPARRALSRAAREDAARPGPRLVRFDFHWTPRGWRISEANTDVPGGLNETSCYPRLLAPHVPDGDPADDVTEIYADALLDGLGDAPRVGLLHATAYTDDRQVMMYLAGRLRRRGAIPHLLAPDALSWSRAGEACAATAEGAVRLDAAARFFPAEWLPNLPGRCGWRRLFAGSATPISNPATALLTQSKRTPLSWDALGVDLPAWRAALPECRDPRELGREDGADRWILKPAMGRVGEHVGVREACERGEWEKIRKAARRWPGDWVAQERFEAVPIEADGSSWYACLGLYTVDGRAAGAYGRISDRPRIDQYARDVAVFIERGA